MWLPETPRSTEHIWLASRTFFCSTLGPPCQRPATLRSPANPGSWSTARSSGGTCAVLCDYNTRTITVCTSLADVDELDTLCHELLHACQGFASEDHVAEVATTLATVLWQLNYRKEANDGR
jgi:hypothetical protein